MLPAHKLPLLKVLEEQLAEKRLQVQKAENSMRERVEQTIGSWSAAGDRAHAENSFHMIKSSLEDLEKLYGEISNCPDGRPEKAGPPCHVVLQTGEKTTEFYLVNTPVKVPGFQLISQKSPIGAAIIGKKPGEAFSQQTDSITLSGQVAQIE